MTWNVKTRDVSHGNPYNLAKLIGNQKPDVVVLQEICASEVPILVDQLRVNYGASYAYELGGVRNGRAGTFPHLPYPGCAPIGDREYGQAILSLHGFVSSKTILFPKGPKEQRGFMRAEVNTGSGSTLPVYTTHIGFDAPAAQVSALAQEAARDPRAVVAGDFNLEPNSPELVPLLDVFDEIDREGRFPTVDRADGTGKVKVDHVFFRGLAPTRGPETFATPSSDHQPLVAYLEL